MKKVFLLAAAAMFFSCSDDDSNESQIDTYLYEGHTGRIISLHKTNDCDDMNLISYCVTDEVFNQLEPLISTTSCPEVTFRDIDGVERHGLVNSYGRGGACTRDRNP